MAPGGNRWRWGWNRWLSIVLWTCLFVSFARTASGCGDHFSGVRGTFHSPGYPDYYTGSDICTDGRGLSLWCWDCYSECVWTITVAEHMSVQLKIDYMDFERRKCCRNYIEVRDGGNDTGTPLAGICGSRIPAPVLSSGNKMYVRLISARNYGKSEHRFSATWSAVCHRNLTEPTGSLQSPGFPGQYPADMDCTYVIWQPRGYVITLNFTSFHLQDSTGGHCSDYLKVYDGGSEAFPLLSGPSCGSTSPGQLISTRNTMYLTFHSDSNTGISGSGFQATYTRKAPDCPTLANLPTEGNLTSPGFPEVFPEEAVCTWKITVTRGHVIDFKFDVIELGPDSDAVLDCDSNEVKTEVSLYDADTADQAKLLARYCKRNAFSPMISTTGRHLTIVYKSKNLNRRSMTYWWIRIPQPLIYGFSASYSSREFDIYAEDETATLLAYGPYTTDSTLGKTGSVWQRTQTVKVESGIPIGSRRYQYVYIHQDGKIGFSDKQNDWWLLYDEGPQSRCTDRDYSSVCVYCTYVNCTSHQDSDIFHKLHKRGNSTTEKLIFDVVNKHVERFKGSDDFNASTVLVVTFHQVKQGKETYLRFREAYSGTATFQVAIAASETEAYAIVTYKQKEMNWAYRPVEQPPIDVGFTDVYKTDHKCQDHVLSRTRKVLHLDEVRGNIAQNGAWVYKLGEVPANAAQACDDWYYKNDGRVDRIRQAGFQLLPKCPCRGTGMRAYGMWVFSGWKESLVNGYWISCYRLTRAAGQNYWPLGKECCYKWGYSYIQDKPDAGSATAYNPSFPLLYQKYIQEDKLAYEKCCIKANSTKHCDKYYELRPIGDCIPEQPFRFAWFCCDPHITTLDERGYTFNGWGEYTMVNMTTPSLTFVLQARTDLAETETGQLGNATVFTAFGANVNGVRVFVELDPSTKDSLIIYGKDEDFSRRFRESPNFLVDTDDFLLQRNNDSFEAVFPSGITIAVDVRQKSLALSLGIPTSFRNKTRGLLGNFNEIKDDDFILPDETSIGPNPTERQIYETFGPAWAVTASNSVMRYGPKEGPQTYSHPDFVPIFLDEQPAEVRSRAESVCGDNLACIYDYVATGSEAFALDSKSVKEMADQTNKLTKNSVPQLEAPSVLRVLSGTTTTFTLSGSDLDGDTLTYHTEDDGGGLVQVNSSTGLVAYTPDINKPQNLRFYSKDALGVQSPLQSVEIFVCTGCSSHGTCDYTSIVPPADGRFAYSFHRVECVCDPGWEGEDCEVDVDGCAGNPCLEGQTCRDLTPQEQGSGIAGFDCGPCPTGFAKHPDAGQCLDINECEDDVQNGCQMTCLNTYGSYQCGCHSGYRLNNDGQTCRDVDECIEKTDECDQVCHNTVGGYECHCEDGYSLDSSGNTCIQDAQLAYACRFSGCSQGCKHGTDPSSGAKVLECFCFAGYDNATEDGAECTDHDECQDSICSQQCVNFNGGFSCTCHIGFHMADDRVTCLPCPPLTYGPNCQYHCRCNGHGVDCNHVTGCVCQQGWRGAQCQDDVDECAENPDICGFEQLCVNTPGSYTCKCLDGYIKDASNSCTDIDECGETSLLNTCGALQHCVNLPGNFHCTCIQGYKMSTEGCVDIDECSLGISDCDQRCTNLPGSYNCDCFYGYRLNNDRATCSQVVDPCASGAGLTCEHGCTLNDGGTAECFCNLGYALNTDQQTCAQVATCSNAGCSHSCSMANGPVCSCPAGMTLDNDLKTCLDCPQGTFGTNCAQNCSCGLGAARCDTTTGCVCQNGWTGRRCESDVNECDVNSVQQECQAKQAMCVNTPGGYRCQCLQGYAMDNTGKCQDINECRESLCGQECENSPGSYRCLCSRGFTLDPATQSCLDVDECALSASNLCTQSCINTDGSYLCVCDRAGFSLDADGVSCIAPVNPCTRTDCPTENGGCSEEKCFCNTGYQLSNTSTCNQIDTDWCSVAVCDQQCNETSDGSSFTCSCRDGYILNDDMRTCRKMLTAGCSRTDCPTGNGGCSEEECFCNSGYHLSDSNTCDLIDTDWCAVARCGHKCHKTSDGSWFTCSCRHGYVLNQDKKTCRDTDWCAVARCDHDCRETSDGSSFICTCRDGYVLNDDGLTCRLVSACRRTDCPTENGGCSKEECFCNSGYHLSDSNTCDRSELATISVTLKVDITTSVPTSELADKTSSGFAALSQDITQELMKKLSGAGRGGISVTVKALRTGSLIIDADVMMDQVGYPNVIKDLAAGLLVVRDSQFTVQGDTGSILQMDINGKRVDSSWTVCEVYQVISPCPAGQQCLVSEGQPVCRSEDSPVTSPGNDDLAIWLGVGIAVLLVIIISVVCLIKRWKKHQKLTGILKDVNNPYIRNVPPHATNANEQPYSSLSRTRSIAEYSTLQLFIVHSPEPHENVSAENTAADYEEPVKISGGVQ